MTEKLIVPGTNIRLVDGSVVKLARFPTVRWVVHNGWYTYNGQQCMGWYFCSIPDKTVLPATEQDLRLITVIDASSSCCPSNPIIPDGGCHPGGCHPKPSPPPLDPRIAYELDRAAITVGTIAERNMLNTRMLPDGKIVKVIDVGENKTEYFFWNLVTQSWDKERFGIDLSSYITLESIQEDEDVQKALAEVVNETILPSSESLGIFRILANTGIITPLASSEGAILTSKDGSVYIL